MENFKRIDLDFKKAMDYTINLLKDTNTLSNNILKQVDFNHGRFFTYLPGDVIPEKIHQLYDYKIATNVRKFVRPLMLNLLRENPDLLCIFDNFNAEFINGYDEHFFLKYGRYFQREVYYILFSKNLDLETFNIACRYSELIWHSLCILSEAKLMNLPGAELTRDDIEVICKKTKLIMLTAYDGEGYIIWKRSK